MKKHMEIFKIAAVYAGAVLGAGFSSGQELMVFFVRYGKNGLWGAALAGILFAIFGAIVLVRVKKEGIAGYKEYLMMILGEKVGKFLYIVAQTFVAVCFCVMLSGGGALFNEQFKLPSITGVLFTAVVCYLILQGDLKRLTTVNMLLVPFMLAGIVLVCSGYLLTESQEVWMPFLKIKNSFITSVFLYVGYNMLNAIAVLVPLSKAAKTNGQATKGGLLGGGALLVTALLTCVVLYIERDSAGTAELPMLVVAQGFGTGVSLLYAVILYMAMLTTAISCGFAVVEHFSLRGRSRKSVSVALCLVSVPLSLIPFSKLVESCFSVFGIIGLLLIAALVYDWFKN